MPRTSSEYELAVAVCALCKHDDHGHCNIKNRDILAPGCLNTVDCSWLRDIVSIARKVK